MQTLPASDKTNGFQKILAFLLLIGVVWGAVKVINPFFADLVELMKNIWWLIGLGTPLVLLTMYIVTNPLVIWGFFKTISWNLTKWLIKMDPLSVMDRYVEYLSKKLKGLMATIEILKGKQKKLDRRMEELSANINTNIKFGKAAMQIKNNEGEVSLYGTKVAGDKETLKLLQPLKVRIDKSLTFMTALADNWKFGIQKLEYQIQRKRDEYEIIKETAGGLKSAEEFINSDSQAGRLYGESLKALEESVTQKMGYIEEFERKSKDIMSAITIEKKVMQDEGLAEIESYMGNNDLFLPDFSNTSNVQDIEFLDIKQVPPVSKFNLLKQTNK